MISMTFQGVGKYEAWIQGFKIINEISNVTKLFESFYVEQLFESALEKLLKKSEQKIQREFLSLTFRSQLFT